MKRISRLQVNAVIRREQGERSIRGYAKVIGVSAPYLSDVLLGRREPGPKILRPLGLRRIKTTKVEYERVRAKGDAKNERP